MESAERDSDVGTAPTLEDWIVAQARRGCSSVSMLQAMLDSGWARDAARDRLEEVLGAARARGEMLYGLSPLLAPSRGGRIWAHDREVQVVMSAQSPIMAVIQGLLDAQECQQLMDRARRRLSRSLTVVETTGANQVHQSRTSEGMFFGRGEDELVERLEARIAALVQWPLERGEGLQVLRYGQGAQYQPHFDYFEPDRAGTAAIVQRGGQRVGTVILYLNTPEDGGQTSFPERGLRVHAQAGTAVFFAYPFAEPGSGSLHAGEPVSCGEKWIATKWLRQGKFE